MATLRSLIECVVNGAASAEQVAALERRLLEDERARDEYLEYLNLHASLGRRFLGGDEVDGEDGEIDGEVVDADQLEQWSQRSSQELWRESRLRHRRAARRWLAALVVAGAGLLALLAYQGDWLNRRSAAIPLVLEASGEVQVQPHGAEWQDLAVGRSVRAGDRLQTRGDEARLLLQYPDATRIELAGDATVVVQRTARGGKQLGLEDGLILADVAAQPPRRPLEIRTPHTKVRVRGTRFELAADKQMGTRLDLESGEVDLLRGAEPPLAVAPNSVAIVPSDAAPVRVLPRPAVITRPRRLATFPGVRSISTLDDGATLVAGAGRQAVFWYPDDRLESIPCGSDDLRCRHQSGSLLLLEGSKPRHLVLWDARSRQSSGEFRDLDGLDREFRRGAERPERWRPPLNDLAAPQQGQWLAVRAGRSVRLWRARDARWLPLVRPYDGLPVVAMAASSDGQRLALAVRRTRIDILQVDTGEVHRSWKIAHKVPHAAEFTDDGRLLAVAFSGRVTVYAVESGAIACDFEQPGLPLIKIAIAADGRHVAAASLSGRVFVWDTTGSHVPTVFDLGAAVRDLTFTADGRQLAVVAQKGRLSVWDLPARPSEAAELGP